MTEHFETRMPRLSVEQPSVPAACRYRVYVGGRGHGKVYAQRRKLSQLIHGDVKAGKEYLQTLAEIRRKAKEEYYRRQEEAGNEPS